MEIERGNEGVTIDECISGDGPLVTFSISWDLGNASHVDIGDEGIGLAIWVEEQPGQAKKFLFYQILL